MYAKFQLRLLCNIQRMNTSQCTNVLQYRNSVFGWSSVYLLNFSQLQNICAETIIAFLLVILWGQQLKLCLTAVISIHIL